MGHVVIGLLGAWFVYASIYGTDIGPAGVAVGLFLGAYVFGMVYLMRN